MEPVAPRIASLVTTVPSSHPDRDGQRESDERSDEDQAVDAIEHAAVPRKQRARVLRPGRSLYRGLEQIARESDRADERRDEQRRSRLDAGGGRDQQRDDRGGSEPRKRSFPRLLRTDPRRDKSSPDRRADEVRRDVGGPRRHECQREPDGESAEVPLRRGAVRHPQIDEISEQQSEIQRATECEHRARDRRRGPMPRAFRDEHDDRDDAERRAERDRHRQQSIAPDRLPEVGDHEEDREHQSDEPRLIRPIPEQRAQLDVAERREDRDKCDERRRWREDGGEDDDAVDKRGPDPPLETAQRPNRRSRFAYEPSASSRSLTEKSGHSTGVAHISAYATSQSKKFDTRSSPPVRISRSGSG